MSKIKLQASAIKNFIQLIPFPFPRKLLEVILNNNRNIDVIFPKNSTITYPKWAGKNLGFKIKNFQEYHYRNIYLLGYHEKRETFLFQRILKPGDTFIDIGANMGWFSLVAANIVGNTGKVISFEPSSHIYSHLKENIELNQFQSITNLNQVACSDKNSHATLQGILEFNEGTGSIFDLPNISGQPTVYKYPPEEVKTIKLDGYLATNNISKIKLIKIDTEGAELNVIQGMKETLRSQLCEYILIEVSDFRLRKLGHTRKELIDILKSYGYKIYQINMFNIKKLTDTETEGNILAKL